jgi:hypothetical protein
MGFRIMYGFDGESYAVIIFDDGSEQPLTEWSEIPLLQLAD